MIGALRRRLAGNTVSARALRGTGFSVLSAFGQHGLRLISNLILTRLLFPEAFGIMALIQVILAGLAMVSTFGLRASVMQDPRGDEPDFLNTAWTLQAIRGCLLWILVCLVSKPVAEFYDEPILAQALPVAGLSLLIQGFFPTSVLTAQRNLQLGRFVVISFAAQIINLVTMTILAYVWGTVWALIVGTVIHPCLMLAFYLKFLPGLRNRFLLEKRSVASIMTLGKYLFLSTIATYVINQSDRAVLGAFIPTDLLGVYSIGFALATLPWMLTQKVSNLVVFPLYRMRPPAESRANQARIFQARRSVAAGTLCLVSVMALFGPQLIGLLYDERYALAGPIIVVLSFFSVPPVILTGVMDAALARGDSKLLMIQNIATATCQMAVLVPGVMVLGVIGAAMAIGVAPILTYPLIARYTYRYGNWDPKGDLGLMTAGFAMTSLALWIYWDEVVTLYLQTHG